MTVGRGPGQSGDRDSRGFRTVGGPGLGQSRDRDQGSGDRLALHDLAADRFDPLIRVSVDRIHEAPSGPRADL